MTETSQTAIELSAHEAERLAHCEAIIERGLRTYVTVGLAILEIQRDRLYRHKYGTFEEYVSKRWDVTREHAYRLIRAAGASLQLREVLSDDSPEPMRESQMRPLLSLESDADRAEAWNRALAMADGQPTAAQVKRAVSELMAERAGPPQETEAQTEETEPGPDDEPIVNTGEHGTPTWLMTCISHFLDLVGLESIDLDPCSSELFNDRVDASSYYTEKDNGLLCAWEPIVYCHPPHTSEAGALWLAKARKEISIGRTRWALMLLDVEVGEDWFRYVWRCPSVFLYNRQRFSREDGSNHPAWGKGSVICLVGEVTDRDEDAFAAAFGALGTVVYPVRDGFAEAAP